MGKIMLTWEGGAYLGHEMLVTSAALLVRAAGHEVVVYGPHDAAPNDAALRHGVRWETLPAPPGEVAPATGLPWLSRASSLWNIGFHSTHVIRDRFEAWDRVFQREQPDLCLLQAAPFAQLSAHAGGYASVEYGVAFDVPPQSSPFPAFRQRETFTVEDGLRFESAIIDRLARVVPAARSVPGLHALVSGDTRLIASIEELDHYSGCNDVTRRFVGPMPMVALTDSPPQWTEGKRPRVLAYVRAALLDAGTLIEAIARLRGDAVVVCVGASQDLVALAARLGVRLHASPVSLAQLLPEADLVISHGGGLISEAQVHGRRCLAIPSHYEQFMTATALKRQGLGAIVNPKEPQTFEAACRHVLASKEIDRNVAALGARYRHFVSQPGAAFLAAVESALDRSGMKEPTR